VSVGTEDEGWNTVHTRTKLYWSVNLIILSCMWNLCFCLYLCYYIVVAACDAALDCFYYFRVFFWFLLSGDISENHSKFNRIFGSCCNFFCVLFRNLGCVLFHCSPVSSMITMRDHRRQRTTTKIKDRKGCEINQKVQRWRWQVSGVTQDVLASP
jgi:hypothetical protein